MDTWKRELVRTALERRPGEVYEDIIDALEEAARIHGSANHWQRAALREGAERLREVCRHLPRADRA